MMRLSSPAVFACLFALGTQASTAGAAEIEIAKTRKPPSVCVGLSESACGAKSECYWRKAAHLKSGKTRRAHCRIKRSAAKSAPT